MRTATAEVWIDEGQLPLARRPAWMLKTVRHRRNVRSALGYAGVPYAEWPALALVEYSRTGETRQVDYVGGLGGPGGIVLKPGTEVRYRVTVTRAPS